jgi:hypothetical protein
MNSPAAPRRSWLWLWILFAFILQLAAWGAWLYVASRHRVDEVPLATPRAAS